MPPGTLLLWFCGCPFGLPGGYGLQGLDVFMAGVQVTGVDQTLLSIGCYRDLVSKSFLWNTWQQVLQRMFLRSCSVGSVPAEGPGRPWLPVPLFAQLLKLSGRKGAYPVALSQGPAGACPGPARHGHGRALLVGAGLCALTDPFSRNGGSYFWCQLTPCLRLLAYFVQGYCPGFWEARNALSVGG